MNNLKHEHLSINIEMINPYDFKILEEFFPNLTKIIVLP